MLIGLSAGILKMTGRRIMRTEVSDRLFGLLLGLRQCSQQLHLIRSSMSAAELSSSRIEETLDLIRQNLYESSSFAADIIFSSFNSESK